MKNLSINPGCIACGACQFIAPQVFHVTDISRVKKGVDLQKYEQAIKEAAKQCPVGVIAYKHQSCSGQRQSSDSLQSCSDCKRSKKCRGKRE